MVKLHFSTWNSVKNEFLNVFLYSLNLCSFVFAITTWQELIHKDSFEVHEVSTLSGNINEQAKKLMLDQSIL